MFDDLAAMFYERVVSKYDAYAVIREVNTAGRNKHVVAGLDAATALFHFREHLPLRFAKTRSEVVADCPDYRLIADVANAAKHGVLTRVSSDGPPLVISVEDIQELVVVTQYEDDSGNYSDSQTAVCVNCTDGVRRSLDMALTTVLNYWGTELARLGVVPFRSREMPRSPGSRFVPRAAAKSPNFEVVQDLRWKQQIQLLKFNAGTGRAEPIDLTDSKLEVTIYRPKYSVLVTATPSDGSKAISCSLELSDDESAAFHLLKTDAERESFANSLFVNRKDDIGRAVFDARRSSAQPEDSKNVMK